MGWKDVFHVQELENPTGKVFYLYVRLPVSDKILLSIESASVECKLTEGEIEDFIRTETTSWPVISLTGDKVTDQLLKLRAANNVAIGTHRGVANTEWEDLTFYQGETKYDGPFAIGRHNDLYAIHKNLNFSSYGFAAR